MLILKATKEDVIMQLKRYSAALNNGRVKKPVLDKISNVFHTLRAKTTDEVRYIEIKESEINDLLKEYLECLVWDRNLVFSVFLGQQTSVYTKKKIEDALKSAVAVYTFPTALATDKIILYLSYLNTRDREVYDFDFAARLLRYDDR